MIYPPEHFDLNEWTVIGFLLLTGIIAFCLRPRFPVSLTLNVLFISIASSRALDHLLAGPFFSDLYDIQDHNLVEWFDLLTYLMFAPPGYLFVYFYDRWHLKGWQVPVYILVWSLLAAGIEGLLSLAHVFTYKTWHLYYSFAVYMIVQPLTLLLFRTLQKKQEQNRQSP